MIITRTKRTDFTERTQNLRESMNVWTPNKRKGLRPYEGVLASINCWSLTIAKSLSDVENEPNFHPFDRIGIRRKAACYWEEQPMRTLSARKPREHRRIGGKEKNPYK
ncbi:hypothetical protein FQR65_LT16190 [Abscondita terminalis]|nr:hypothetical protein FQR65_LT16190 [Abscondita terminalis]